MIYYHGIYWFYILPKKSYPQASQSYMATS